MNTERYSRQTSLVPIERINTSVATIVGVGAIGRNVALQLASIGVPKLRLIDFDIVEESNIASQGYKESDLGMFKVEATGAECKKINKDIQLTMLVERYKKSMDPTDIVFSCVDNMSIRKLIFNSVKDKSSFYADGRMAAETLRVLNVTKRSDIEKYEKTLFSDGEAYQGSCTAKTTIYCANIAAGYLVASFAKWLRGAIQDPDVLINLYTNEIIVGSE